MLDFSPTAVNIKSGGRWTQWCGSERASLVRLPGIQQKQAGVWLRVRNNYAGDRSIDAGVLREICMNAKRKSDVIPGVERGHVGPLAVAHLDQIVVIPAPRLAAYRVCDAPPSAGVIEEVSNPIGNLPAEPPPPFALARFRSRKQHKHLQFGDSSTAPLTGVPAKSMVHPGPACARPPIQRVLCLWLIGIFDPIRGRRFAVCSEPEEIESRPPRFRPYRGSEWLHPSPFMACRGRDDSHRSHQFQLSDAQLATMVKRKATIE